MVDAVEGVVEDGEGGGEFGGVVVGGVEGGLDQLGYCCEGFSDEDEVGQECDGECGLAGGRGRGDVVKLWGSVVDCGEDFAEAERFLTVWIEGHGCNFEDLL